MWKRTRAKEDKEKHTQNLFEMNNIFQIYLLTDKEGHIQSNFITTFATVEPNHLKKEAMKKINYSPCDE